MIEEGLRIFIKARYNGFYHSDFVSVNQPVNRKKLEKLI